MKAFRKYCSSSTIEYNLINMYSKIIYKSSFEIKILELQSYCPKLKHQYMFFARLTLKQKNDKFETLFTSKKIRKNQLTNLKKINKKYFFIIILEHLLLDLVLLCLLFYPFSLVFQADLVDLK